MIEEPSDATAALDGLLFPAVGIGPRERCARAGRDRFTAEGGPTASVGTVHLKYDRSPTHRILARSMRRPRAGSSAWRCTSRRTTTGRSRSTRWAAWPDFTRTTPRLCSRRRARHDSGQVHPAAPGRAGAASADDQPAEDQRDRLSVGIRFDQPFQGRVQGCRGGTPREYEAQGGHR
jgi:hypothetical protein